MREGIEVSEETTEIGVLAESESFTVWVADDPDGEPTYHLEMGAATLHLFQEEWEELVGLIAEADKNAR
jgi:hypothetical protein